MANLSRPELKKRPDTRRTESPKWTYSMEVLKCIKYRKIMRRSDFIKILFVCVCVCHVCPAHPCGSNPMSRLQNFSVRSGIAPGTTLQLLESNYPRDYTNFMTEYREYNECMRMLHTGYFKRSADTHYSNRKRGALTLSDIISEASSGDKRRHKRYGLFNQRSLLRELVSRDRNYDDTPSDSEDDDLNLDIETVNEDDIEKTLPSLLKKISKRHKDVAVIIVEPSHQDDAVSDRPRRHRRRRHRR